ncbi:MAG: hypothetical protein PHI97_10535 [Desulfobulbus sp.]|nr:hypothetical protein [Desulfobulbus sp.]
MTGRQAPHTYTSGRAQVLGLIFKELPTNSADEAEFAGLPLIEQSAIRLLPCSVVLAQVEVARVLTEKIVRATVCMSAIT